MNSSVRKAGRLSILCAPVLLSAALLGGGCDKGPDRQSFTEAAPPPASSGEPLLPAGHPPLSSMTNAAGGGAMGMPAMPPMARKPIAPVTWTAPAGWTGLPGQSMRFATFLITNAQGAAECSGITLAGNAGGVASNVQRWAGQVGLSLSPEQLKTFADGLKEEKTAAGQPLWIVDLTTLPVPDGAPADAPSMLAAIVNRENDTVFLKLTAPRALIALERARLRELAMSVK